MPPLVCFTRYFYNSSSNNCEGFLYGGCDGNENNFRVKEACENFCKKPNKTEESVLLKVGPEYPAVLSRAFFLSLIHI